MKKNILQSIKRLAFLTAVVFIGFSCSKEEDEGISPAPDYGLNVSENSVRPMQMVSINVEGIIVSEAKYDGFFGSLPVELVKENDNTLLLIVPSSISEGEHMLKVALNANEKQVRFSVEKKLDLPDGNAYLNSFLTSAKTELAYQGNDERIKSVTSSLEGWIQSYEEALSGLTSDQKNDLALLLKTNIQVEEERLNARIQNYDCFDRHAPVYLTNLAFALAGGRILQLGQAIHARFPGLGLAGAIYYLQGLVGVYNSVDNILDCPIFRYLESYKYYGRLLDDNLLEFNSNEKREILLNANYKSLDRNDTTHPVSLISKIAKSIIDFESFLSELKHKLNSLRSFFGVNATNLDISDEPVLQAEGQTQIMPLIAGTVTVENISNNLVKLINSNFSDGKLSVEFKSESLSTQDFEFDLLIVDGPIEHREKVVSKIQPEPIEIKAEGLENLFAERGSELQIKALIQTNSGTPIRNADVKFTVINGQGEFTPSTIKTDQNGHANTKLLVSNDHQDEFDFLVSVLNESDIVVKEEILTIEEVHPIIGKWDCYKVTVGGGYINGQIVSSHGEVEFANLNNELIWIFNSDFTWEIIDAKTDRDNYKGDFLFEEGNLVMKLHGGGERIGILDYKIHSVSELSVVLKDFDGDYFKYEMKKIN